MNVNDKKLKLQMWDTAGQERFKSIAPLYFRDAHCILVTFDVTDESTFENIHHWLDQVEAQGPAEVAICIMANKVDLTDKRVVDEKEVKELADSVNAGYQESSALLNTGVNVDFWVICF
jgi:small GTP-binding protein